LVFCGHRPRHAIEPAWIRANSGPTDTAGSEWYADLLAAHLKAPRTRLIDGKASDDPGEWSLSRNGLLLLEPQLLTPGGPVSRLEVLAAVTGLGDADRLELWLSAAGADPWPVAILRPPAGPHGGASVEVCHGLEGGLLPRDPVRIGVKLTRSPASLRQQARQGVRGLMSEAKGPPSPEMPPGSPAERANRRTQACVDPEPSPSPTIDRMGRRASG
jgi:hypothetical protein